MPPATMAWLKTPGMPAGALSVTTARFSGGDMLWRVERGRGVD